MAESTTVQLTEENFDATLKQHARAHDGRLLGRVVRALRKAIAPVPGGPGAGVGGASHPGEGQRRRESRGLAGRYGIRSIPTILFVKAGKVVDQVIGAVPKTKLKESWTRWLSSA